MDGRMDEWMGDEWMGRSSLHCQSQLGGGVDIGGRRGQALEFMCHHIAHAPGRARHCCNYRSNKTLKAQAPTEQMAG